MKYLTVIQHNEAEWLGHLEDHFEGRGIRFGYQRPFTTGGRVPDVATVGDGLILLGGGSWGAVSPDHRLPSLDAEVRLARACLMLDKPVLGIGLGAQILSLAADGGAAATALTFTTGVATRVQPSALHGFLPERVPQVVFMRDEPHPPSYAEILATDAAGRPAIFSVAPRAFGFVAHPGVRRAMMEELVMATDDAPETSAASLAEVGTLATAIEDALVPLMTGLIRQMGWMPT